MADIDMIPRSYRDRVRVRATARVTAAALVLVVLAGAGASALLRWQTATTEKTLALRAQRAAAAQGDAARDAAQRQQQERLAQADSVLHALRRDGEFAALVRGLDAALSDGVWLTGLHVGRDAQQLGAGTAAASDDLVITAPAGAQTWRLASTLQLDGQAASLEAVSAFLAALQGQPGIRDLVLDGSTLDDATGVVTFRASATLKTQVAR